MKKSILRSGILKFLGAVFAWVDIMERIKAYTDPSGYGLIQEVIDSLNSYHKDYTTNNLSDLLSLWKSSGEAFKKLVPHIMNEKLSAALADVGNQCIQRPEVLKNGNTLDAAAYFVEKLAHQLLTAMGVDY